MVGAEEKSGQPIGINMTFEPHLGPALDVKDNSIPVVEGRRDAFRAHFPGQFEEVASIELV